MNETPRLKKRVRILFLCTGNSCRSQMAEGFAKDLKCAEVEAYSAGIEPRRLDPRAVKIMSEVGIDISGQHSKHLDDVDHVEFDWVITLCGHADANCPSFSRRTKMTHVGFDDPPTLAENAKSEEEALSHYRRVRDEIKAFVERLPEALGESCKEIQK
jgi:arsenate reductase